MTLNTMRSVFPLAYRRLPAKIARARFVCVGTTITGTTEFGVWEWTGAKWRPRECSEQEG